MYLLEASVTGTETALLAAALARGRTEIRNAAREPHVAELCAFLAAMGAGVEGIGGSTIRIEPPARLRGATHTLRGDYIEAASWGVVAAITGGDVEVTGVHAEDLEPITAVLAEMQLEFELEDMRFAVGASSLVGARRITTGLWPGFPSDIVSLVTVLATQAQGATLVHDWMYELRLFALEQLSSMRGDLFLCDPHRIIVNGPTRLRGRTLDSRDIRSGMALIAAALAAEGQSTILSVETVERGYGDLMARLAMLGASVARRDD
jgi:UDP-N-acetylglucosamine 1-carboxyvinyltransferase